jgi:hypothetical protein
MRQEARPWLAEKAASAVVAKKLSHLAADGLPVANNAIISRFV